MRVGHRQPGSEPATTHHVQAATVHQGRQLMQAHLRRVQHRLHLIQTRLNATRRLTTKFSFQAYRGEMGAGRNSEFHGKTRSMREKKKVISIFFK